MPEQEFEIYLSLLSRLLRLSPAQKAAISDELRDHLEQRLSELIQKGVARDEAIRVAMEEFGDVTGLALDLTRVSRTPLKKVIVRSTLAGSAVAAAIVGWLALFAPEHRVIAPVPAQAQQEPQPPAQIVEPAVAAASVVDEELFPVFLLKPTSVTFEDAPLNEVCDYLADINEIPVMLNRTHLSDEGIALDTPVTLKLTELTYEEVLNHLTRRLGLGWEVDSGIIRIGARDPERYMIRYFDLRNLSKLGLSQSSVVDALRLAADGWESTGEGIGTTALIGDTLAVRQTYQQQRRIAKVLAAIEGQQAVTTIETCTGRDRLLQKLKEPATVQFVDNPLTEALDFLSAEHEIPILLNAQSLNDEGVAPDAAVTLTITNRPLAKVLEAMLAELHLKHVIRDGVLMIETTSTAAEETSTLVYNVRDLADVGETLAQLPDVIRQTTTGSWLQTDGSGGDLILSDGGGCLLVRQVDSVQAEIQTLLQTLRKARKDGAAEIRAEDTRRKLVTKNYRLPTEIATDLSGALALLVSPENWKEEGGETPSIHLVAASPQQDHVDGMVSGGSSEIQTINSQEPSSDRTRPPTTTVKSIVIRPRSLLIIRQTPRMHREIQKFLKNLNVAADIGDTEHGLQPGWMGGGGGGGGYF